MRTNLPRNILLAWLGLSLTVALCKKMLFVDLLNGVNVNYKRKVPICKRPTRSAEYLSSQPLHANRNVEQTSSKNGEASITNHEDEKDENILQQYIYTLSHLTIFDVDRDKSTPLNIALLLKACLASHNYIKNVEIFTSNVKNKEICSFIYERRNDFDAFFKLHVMKYIDFFGNPQIVETLKSSVDNKEMYQRELEIFNQIDGETKLRKDLLEDILFECTRLNKIIQYSLAVNNFNLFSPTVLLKLFTYFKHYGVYYSIFLNNIKKVKYYYQTKDIREEDKRKIEKIVDHYLLTLDRFNHMYEAGHVTL
ncbi:liver merozoite formation protein, putative [Plasmodium vivax]|nr:liver merozoite formation protein, putative [Plasmodium vivax]